MNVQRVGVRYCVVHEGIANEDDDICDFSDDGMTGGCDFRQLFYLSEIAGNDPSLESKLLEEGVWANELRLSAEAEIERLREALNQIDLLEGEPGFERQWEFQRPFDEAQRIARQALWIAPNTEGTGLPITGSSRAKP